MEKKSGVFVTDRAKWEGKEARFVAYQLLDGVNAHSSITFYSRNAAAEFFGKSEGTVLRNARNGHTIKDKDGEIWYVFTAEATVKYIESILEIRL